MLTVTKKNWTICAHVHQSHGLHFVNIWWIWPDTGLEAGFCLYRDIQIYSEKHTCISDIAYFTAAAMTKIVCILPCIYEMCPKEHIYYACLSLTYSIHI